jgi:hypothetical protein
MRPFKLAILGSSLLQVCVGACGAAAQASTGQADAAALSKARALYYTPVDSGLQGFHCEVNFAWRDFMQKASNQAVPEADARLAYLQGTKLSVDDDLRGQGRLNWVASGPVPEGSQDSVDKVRGGMQQLWSGFFQSWNGFFTGDMLTLDLKANIEHNGSGYHVAVRDGANLAEEQFDSNLLLQTVHVVTPSIESTITPTFTPGPQKLLVSSIHSVYRQPPTAEPTEVVMGVTYAPVNGFQLPSEVRVAVGPASFDFHLVNCTVQTR